MNVLCFFSSWLLSRKRSLRFCHRHVSFLLPRGPLCHWMLWVLCTCNRENKQKSNLETRFHKMSKTNWPLYAQHTLERVGLERSETTPNILAHSPGKVAVTGREVQDHINSHKNIDQNKAGLSPTHSPSKRFTCNICKSSLIAIGLQLTWTPIS